MKKTLLLLVAGTTVWAVANHDTASSMWQAASLFLSSLTAEQRALSEFPFDGEEREKWHYSNVSRNGLPYGRLEEHQHKLANALLATGLSSQGVRKANEVMYLDHVLHVLENNNPGRDPNRYYFSFFGQPSMSGRWGWRLEGHHLSLNFTVQDGEVIASSPFFFGANPGEVRQGPHQGLRVLSEEEDLARRLLKSLLAAGDRRVLTSQEAPSDITTRVERKVTAPEAAGVRRGEMSAEQTALLDELLETYLGKLDSNLAESHRARMRRAGLEAVHFAWAGGTEPGEPHYYRIQGPTFLVEYDNTQNNANHIHTVWRDFQNDFGRDLLSEHYAASH